MTGVTSSSICAQIYITPCYFINTFFWTIFCCNDNFGIRTTPSILVVNFTKRITFIASSINLYNTISNSWFAGFYFSSNSRLNYYITIAGTGFPCIGLSSSSIESLVAFIAFCRVSIQISFTVFDRKSANFGRIVISYDFFGLYTAVVFIWV